MRRTLLLVAAVALAACTAAPSASGKSQTQSAQIRAALLQTHAALNAPGVVAVGVNETADLGDGLTLRVIAVVEDSRCPADVECVWAGRLRLRVAIPGLAGESEIVLGQTLDTPRGGVTFIAADPPRFASWPSDAPPKPAYRFGFRRTAH